MFKTRLLSGIVLVAVLILTVGMGGPVLYTVLLAASLIGLMELYRTVKVQNQALGIVGYLGAIGYYILMYQNKMEYIMPLIILVLMLAMAVYVFAYPKHLKMVGRYNSLFAFDDTLLKDEGKFSEYIKNGIDRIVLNFI